MNAAEDRAKALTSIETALESLHSAMQDPYLLGVRFRVEPVGELTGSVGKGIDLRYSYLPDSEIKKIDAQYANE